MTPVNQDRAEGFLNEYGPFKLVKSSIVQMACSTQLLVATMLTLVKIMREHRDSNLAEVERLTKMLDENEVVLVEWMKKANQWVMSEANL